MKNSKTAIDLFSGCGGLTTGLKMAGFEVLSAIEFDKKAAETYSDNHPEVLLIKKNIIDQDPYKLMTDLGLKPGELDLMGGCPPCQGFSSIGRKNKAICSQDTRNDLIDEFYRFIFAFSPKSIILENVPALTDYKKFEEFKKNIKNLKYEINYSLVNAEDFGVPQRRLRLILMASKIKKPDSPQKEAEKQTVRDAIAHLKSAGSSGDDLHDFPEKRSNKIMELISLIPKNGGSRRSLPAAYQLACHQRNNGFHDVYGRMCWDEPSPTITGGCTNPSKGRFLHPEENRAITMREAAILQSFPEDYIFNINHGKTSISQMIGNALPPNLIKKHALELMRIL